MAADRHSTNELSAEHNQRLPPKTQEPADPYSDILAEKIDVSPSDLILPVTFLGITLLGILFVLAILIIWLKNYIAAGKNAHFRHKEVRPPRDFLRTMEQNEGNAASKSCTIAIDPGEKEDNSDDFEFKLPTTNNKEEKVEYVGDNQRNLAVVSTRNYGGSSPKLPEKDNQKRGAEDSKLKFVFPLEERAKTCQPSTSKGSIIESKCGKFKIAIPEQQWRFHQKGFSVSMPKPFPLAEAVKVELGVGRPKTFSVTRSPSLEKDDKSPFVASAKSEKVDQFKFTEDAVFAPPVEAVPVPKYYSSQDNFHMGDRLTNFPTEDIQAVHKKYSLNGRRSEVHECSSAKEKSTYTKFNFSPKQLCYSACETNGATQRFFPSDTPKLRTPRSNKENCFTFDEVDATRKTKDLCNISNRNQRLEQPRLAKQNSFDVTRFDNSTPLCENNNATCDTVATSVGAADEPTQKTDNNNSTIQIDNVEMRRQRLKSISLDSDNAKIIEQNLGLPIAKHIKQDDLAIPKRPKIICGNITPTIVINKETRFSFDRAYEEPEVELLLPYELSPNILSPKRRLMDSSNTKSFTEMQPRFSPKEFDLSTDEAARIKSNKNLKNLTIDLSKKDSDLEKELLEFERLYSEAEKRLTPKTPTLKIKATSLDSSDTLNLSLPQKKTLDVPQNSISVPNTPKRQFKRIIGQKVLKKSTLYNTKLNEIAKVSKPYAKSQDSGIYLRDNHANLMLFQGPKRVVCPNKRWMGSFDENLAENAPEINVSEPESTNLLTTAFKQNLSVSSTNLKTLPEGIPSDFEPSEKTVKKSILQRRGSNQSLTINLDGTQSSLKYSALSLQGSNCSLASFGVSNHNLASIRNSASNFSLNTDNRAKKNILERRNSNTSLTLNLDAAQRVAHEPDTGKKCLLQRRGSNNSLTLSLSRFTSNSSLNIAAVDAAKNAQRKSLLERRSSNTSLALNVSNRALSVSNYNLNGSSTNLSQYNSNQSIPNSSANADTNAKKGLLERRSSNTSLTLNIQDAPREIEVEPDPAKNVEAARLMFAAHRRSLSTENLLPRSYKRLQQHQSTENTYFGSHDNLWSNSYVSEMDEGQNLTYVCGDQENEMIYAFNERQNPQGFIRNITTKPLSPQSTSEEFKIYLANIQHLQNASNILTRQHLKDLNIIFRNLYPNHADVKPRHNSSSSTDAIDKIGSVLHELSLKPPENEESKTSAASTCSDYQKSLLRNLHQEFWDLPTNFQEKPLVFGSHTKNRYKTILPNEHSRFILKPQSENGSEGYINANFIKGHEYSRNCYIATQGPLQNTVYDFWLMVYQNSCQFKQTCTKTNEDRHFGVPQSIGELETGLKDNLVQKIVMLTGFVENNRQKCERYFPIEENDEVEFVAPRDSCGLRRLSENPFADSPTSDEATLSAYSLKIKNVCVTKKSGYEIRKLNLEYVNAAESQNSDVLTVYHYWFDAWADHQCPKDVSTLLDLSIDVLEGDTGKAEQPPIIAHCAAGIGRTGCLIAILNGIRQLIADERVDILGIVCNMRLNRGGMVQNSEQYELIHKVLCLYEEVYMSG